jgi:hypothetical protein
MSSARRTSLIVALAVATTAAGCNSVLGIDEVSPWNPDAAAPGDAAVQPDGSAPPVEAGGDSALPPADAGTDADAPPPDAPPPPADAASDSPPDAPPDSPMPIDAGNVCEAGTSGCAAGNAPETCVSGSGRSARRA